MAVVGGVEGGICAGDAGVVEGIKAGSSWAGEAVAVLGVTSLAGRAVLAGGVSVGEGVGGAGSASTIALEAGSRTARETLPIGIIAGEAACASSTDEGGSSRREGVVCADSKRRIVGQESWVAR